MIKHKINGHVVHVCSITGHYVPYVPGWSVYPATKHAVAALTETMRQELNYMDSQIKISVSKPQKKHQAILAKKTQSFFRK